MRARLFLLGAALFAFGASLGSGFHFDDYAIGADASLASASGWLAIFSLRQTRPLTFLTLWVNYAFEGMDHAVLYHAVNLALHLGAVALAWECLRRLLPERAAFAACAIFALHPIQAEAVNYVWARGILLATLLCLAALLEWLEGRSWIAVAWFAAALLAKEEAAAFPLVLWWLDRKRRAPALVMLALSAAAGLRAFYATAVVAGSGAGLQAGITPGHYFLAQGIVILRYLRLLIVPYGFTVDPDIRIPPVWMGATAWVAVAILAVLAWRYARWALAGLVLLIPSSTVFPAADLAADRRMYLPLFAFAAAAGPWLAQVWTVRILAAFLAVLSLLRTDVWMTDRALWTEAVERAPAKARPRIWLARAQPAGQALETLEQAANLAPYDATIPAETGKIYLSEKRFEDALAEFGRALALDPRDARNYNNRGVALASLGQSDAARADFERALRIDPALAEARQNLHKMK
jgi:tetratricopeptide (TPR) repeat protein